jgi:hypothetical protein
MCKIVGIISNASEEAHQCQLAFSSRSSSSPIPTVSKMRRLKAQRSKIFAQGHIAN